MSAPAEDPIIASLENLQPTPEEAAKFRALDLEERLLDLHWTDGGNAERFLEMHASIVINPVGLGLHVWDGKRWKVDRENRVQELAGETIRMLYQLAGSKKLDADKRESFLKFALRSDRLKPRRDMVELASSSPLVVRQAHELDADHYAFNCANGIINLRDGTLSPHRQDALCTMLSPVEYNPQLDWREAAPTWLRFLHDVFRGDHGLIDFAQKAMGYALTGDASEEIMLMLWGEGENGKSKFIEIMLAVFGEYATAADPSLLMAKRHEGGPAPELLKLRGKRLISAIETAADRRLDTTLLKRLTGRDTITARAMRSDNMVEFALQALIVLATNNKPKLPETGQAIRRRLRLIPWLASFTKEAGNRDDHIIDKLIDERAGILKWLVDGCIAWQRDGLPDVDAIDQATDSYLEEEDPIARFIADRCYTAPDATARAGELYDAYAKWSAEQHEATTLNVTQFGKALARKHFDVDSDRRGKFRKGISLQAPLEADYYPETSKV